AVERPYEVGGEDEAALEYGDHDQVFEPRRGDVASELIDAGRDRLGAEQRLDRALSGDVHGRHLALANRTWRLRTLSGGEGICTAKGDLPPAPSGGTFAVTCDSTLP